ncbi:AraC family transcriptional regulator [Mucilaginibacter sp.]|uniref:helix-turn-helix domain-containing protein n=1 Tax=Mucilaginibacter sp. TaxID=1882438 RepID=UPI0025F96F4A|nr:AraC family transcriptional regulator [Mucilaginibacter sp.]
MIKIVMVSYWDNDEVLRYASLKFLRQFNISDKKKIGTLTLSELLGPLYNSHLPHLTSVLSGNPRVFEQDLSDSFTNLRLCIITYYPDWKDNLPVGFYLQIFEKPEINLHDPDLMMAINQFNNSIVKSSSSGQSYEEISVIDPQIERVAEYLKSILLSKFPGLSHIAEIHFMSASKLKRDFKVAYGVSPFIYFRKLQMDVAEQYLKEKRYRIGELATIFNFSNPYNFTSCYNRFKNKSIDLKLDLLSILAIFMMIFECELSKF